MLATSKAVIEASPGAMDIMLILAVVLFLVSAIVCWIPPTKNIVGTLTSVGLVFLSIGLMFTT